MSPVLAAWDDVQGSGAEDAAPSLRLAEASVSRSPGRHARTSSRAGVSSRPVKTPAYQRSSGHLAPCRASAAARIVQLSSEAAVGERRPGCSLCRGAAVSTCAPARRFYRRLVRRTPRRAGAAGWELGAAGRVVARRRTATTRPPRGGTITMPRRPVRRLDVSADRSSSARMSSSSTVRASNWAKAAPTQRRTPPPKGSHAPAGGRVARNRSTCHSVGCA